MNDREDYIALKGFLEQSWPRLCAYHTFRMRSANFAGGLAGMKRRLAAGFSVLTEVLDFVSA